MTEPKDISISPKSSEERKALEHYNAMIICKEFGWTYQELQDTPKEFIDSIISITKIKNAKANVK